MRATELFLTSEHETLGKKLLGSGAVSFLKECSSSKQTILYPDFFNRNYSKQGKCKWSKCLQKKQLSPSWGINKQPRNMWNETDLNHFSATERLSKATTSAILMLGLIVLVYRYVYSL